MAKGKKKKVLSPEQRAERLFRAAAESNVQAERAAAGFPVTDAPERMALNRAIDEVARAPEREADKRRLSLGGTIEGREVLRGINKVTAGMYSRKQINRAVDIETEAQEFAQKTVLDLPSEFVYGQQVSEEEKAALGAAAIEAENARYTREEGAEDLERVIAEQQALYPGTRTPVIPTERVRAQMTEWTPSEAPKFYYGTGQYAATVDENRFMAMLPDSMRNKEMKELITTEMFPELKAAQMAAGFSPDETVAVTNFALAVKTAELISKSYSQERRKQLLASLPKMQAALVIDVMNAAADEWEDRMSKAEEVDRNALISGVETIAGMAGGAVLDFLTNANEFVQHYVRATMVSTADGPIDFNGWERWSNAWDQTERGAYDEESLNWAREQFGGWKVDMILELRNAERGEEDTIGSLVVKYEDNPEKMAFLDSILNGWNYNQENLDLATYIDTIDGGSIGNLFNWSLATAVVENPIFGGTVGFDDLSEDDKKRLSFEFANTPLFTAVRNGVDVTATFALDPTLLAGKARMAYLGARYGVYRVAKAGGGYVPQTMEKVFKTRAVRNYFDYLGKELKAINMETSVTKRAQMFNSLAAQNKKFFDDRSLYLLEKGVGNIGKGDYAVDDFMKFFADGDNIGMILRGQTARRGVQMQVPHITGLTAKVKETSLKLRGLTWQKNTDEMLDQVFGSGTAATIASLIDEINMEQVAAAAAGATKGGDYASRRIEAFALVNDLIIDTFTKDDTAKTASEFLSKFVLADGQGKRTFIGAILSGKNPFSTRWTAPGEMKSDYIKLAESTRWYERILPGGRRYGFQKKGGVRRRVEGVARTMSHMPDAGRPIFYLDDPLKASGADQMRDALLYAGISPWWANTVRYAWLTAKPEQRKQIAAGVTKTFIYASGLHVLDPGGAEEFARSLVGSMANTQIYAPNTIDEAFLAGLSKTIRENQIKNVGAANAESADGILARLKLEIANGEIVTPELRNSMDRVVKNASSYVDDNGKLVNSAVFLGQTSDYLLMPDFAKIAQIAMRKSYLQALVGNNAGMSTLTDYWVAGTLLGPRFQMRSGIEDFGLFALTGGSMKGFRLGRRLSQAMREASGQKLGLFKTLGRKLANKSKLFAKIVFPNLDPEKVVLARKMARNGDRAGMLRLMRVAMFQRRASNIDDVDLQDFSNMTGLKPLTSAQQEIMTYVDDMYKYAGDDADQAIAQVSDSAAAQVSGQPVGTSMASGYSAYGLEKPRTVQINLKTAEIRRAEGKYTSQRLITEGPGSERALEDWLQNIVFPAATDGPKGQQAIILIRDYHFAVKSNNVEKQNEIIKQLADTITINDKRYGYTDLLIHGGREGAEGLAKRTLDAVLPTFRGRNPDAFNEDLYNLVVKFDKNGKKIVDINDLELDDLRKLQIKPAEVYGRSGLEVAMIPGEKAINTFWEMTGRSLARVTREPIFFANYIDSRKMLKEFQETQAAIFGDEVAARWATEIAMDRAVRTTMDYVDNPAVRSQLAWNMRNVARFYRALEDFNRRIVRTAKNQPMAFWKLALGWNVMDDSGFVYTDERGDKYIVWPILPQAFAMFNWMTSSVFGYQAAGFDGTPEFTSKVNMFTPSGDPNALMPSFHGVYAGAFLKPIIRQLPLTSALENELFGEYSVSQEIWRGVLPPHLTRIFELGLTAFNNDSPQQQFEGEFESTYANNARQAMMIAYNAMGDFSEETGFQSIQDKSNMAGMIDRIAIDLMAFKFASGFFLPAAYQQNVTGSTTFAKEMGFRNLRPLFIEILKEKEGDIGQAAITFYKMNPDLSIWTLSESDLREETGYWSTTKDVMDFVKENRSFVVGNPAGASFFAPDNDDSQNTLAAYNYMKSLGLKPSKSVSEAFEEIFTQRGYTRYQIERRKYEENLLKMPKAEADRRWAAQKKVLYNFYPNLESRVLPSGLKSANESDMLINSVYDASQEMLKNEYYRDRANLYIDSINVYRDYREGTKDIDPDVAREYRQKWLVAAGEAAMNHPNDKKYLQLLDLMSAGLDTESEFYDWRR